jgi:hypothetical protein
MTRTGIDCGLGKTLQQEPNARGINSREPCAMTPNPSLERTHKGRPRYTALLLSVPRGLRLWSAQLKR